MDRPGSEVEIRKPPIGFALPAIEGTVEEDPEHTGKWTRVVVAEEKPGFVVKDRRQIR